ncbi:uncharacterized protein LOC124326523 isoform X2 [Daphnia pulicaria]|nr:uncharacterized protein LOC124326523 isoform X2 [Daphnia pulicaria]
MRGLLSQMQEDSTWRETNEKSIEEESYATLPEVPPYYTRATAISHQNFNSHQQFDMKKASVSFIYALVIWAVEMVADTPVGVGTIAGNYLTASNGIVAYLPATRYPSMPWALQRVQNAPKVVSPYLPESKPWALPSRFPDTPSNVVAAYLPAQYSSAAIVPWRLPLQTSGSRFSYRR